ncbi:MULTISPECIES: hypothetical protein [unclassified Hahella]|uniref:hypothetical protein n=1 Tax=unclassified Hahella TaxID=2624107 RepID=UPI001C1EE24D|nr:MULTISPECIES: hypothetical protein [unclassified Hahella]MBU6952526.1 hypothetical protein [Hahella sp. HN01]MDG9672009.1 hypothetical protein [Hahella sp. CR1]
MSSYRCRKCKNGILIAAVQGHNETELTETYECDACGHVAVIPSRMIICSQMVTSFIGGLITAYLFIEQLSIFVTVVQFNIERNLTQNIVLLVVSLLFLAGFGYTLYTGMQGLAKRKFYLKAPQRDKRVRAS